MRLGFSFRETMRGSYWRLDAPTFQRAIGFTIDATAPNLVEFARSKNLQVKGTVHAEGITSAGVIEGAVSFRLLSERRIPYRLSFTGEDDRRYVLSGQREWSALGPVDSLTILEAGLYDESGDEVGRVTLRFDLRADLASWMKSFRLRFERD